MHLPPRGPIYAFYYTALAVIAIPVNLTAIVILSQGKCGLSRCITRYLVAMAVTDLLVIITAVLLNRLPGIYFPGSFMSITPVCSVSITLNHFTRDSSVWLTVAFTFDRFVAICCQKMKTEYCTEKTAAYAIGTVYAVGCVKSIPWYFMHEPIYMIDSVPWYCRVRLARYTSPLWKLFDWASHLLTPCLAFLLILLLNVLTVRHILAANRARRRLRGQSNGENHKDPEMESRKRSMILLFAISGSFILLWVTYLALFIYKKITGDFQIKGIFVESANMLLLFSCCTNTFIYAVTQRKFRQQFMTLVHCPMKLKHKL